MRLEHHCLDLSWLRCFTAAGACRQSSVALETQMMDEKEGAHTKDHKTCGGSWRPRPPINAGLRSPTNSKKPLFSRLSSVHYLRLGFPPPLHLAFSGLFSSVRSCCWHSHICSSQLGGHEEEAQPRLIFR